MSIPLITSLWAKRCGVVTTIAPVKFNTCVSVSWISPVPGGCMYIFIYFSFYIYDQ